MYAISRVAVVLSLALVSCEDPIVWDFTMVNNGLDNVHLFLASEETKAGSNKVDQGQTKPISYSFGNADDLPEVVTIEAWRGETMMASTTCPGAPADDQGWTVTFSEEAGVSLSCVSD